MAALKGKNMSTGFDQTTKSQHHTFDDMDKKVETFDITGFTAQGAVQDAATRTQRLATVYATARPIIAAVSAIPLIPAKWRAVLSVFLVTLDEVTATWRPARWNRNSPRDLTQQQGKD
jgi:hypothetical protein